MSSNSRDIERIEEDLSTIKQAAGIEYSFGWADVYGELLIGVLSLAAAPFTILPFGLSIAKAVFLALGLLLFILLLVLRIRFRKSTGKSPSRRKLYTSSLWLLPIVVALLWLYPKYILSRFSLSPEAIIIAAGALCFGAGLGMSLGFVISPQHRTSLPAPVAVAIAGLLVPFCPSSHIVLLVIVSTACAAIMVAAIEARILLKAGIPHGTD